MADVCYDLVAGRLYFCCMIVKQMLQFVCKVQDILFHHCFFNITTLLLFSYIHVTDEFPIKRLYECSRGMRMRTEKENILNIEFI
jgi:hypothetical protein